MYKMKRCVLLASIMLAMLATLASADLVGHWKLDESAGDTAKDSSGNGNDGAVTGDPQWVTGTLDGAIELDGDDIITIADYDAAQSDQYTVAAWVNIPVVQTGGHTSWVVSKGVVGGLGGWGLAVIGQTPTAYQENGTTWNAVSSGMTIALNEWHHIAATYDGTSMGIHVDGVLAAAEDFGFATSPIDIVIGAWRPTNLNRFYIGTVDDVQVYAAALSEAEIQVIMNGLGDPGQASSPVPASEATDVIRDGIVLQWKAGEFATSHDVYFGTNFEDVNTATPDSPEFMGNQLETAYTLDRLEFGATYFWRIDEVNDTHADSPWQGNTWIFEVEPEGIMIDGGLLTATASSQNSADESPDNTINGVGLNEDGSHSQDKTTMWLSAISDPGTAWIRYDLSIAQELHEMLVWNQNGQSEEDLGVGFKEARIEVSVDGIEFTTLGIVELAQAAETVVDMQNVVVKSVRITAVSNWGGFFPKYGLSKVRFLVIPNAAREMSPVDGDATVDPSTAALTWRAGRNVAVHHVYLSTDEQAVIDGTAPMVTVAEASYMPALDLEMSYYWRVDEVNDLENPSVWIGDIQNFSTLQSLPVDDMESYKVDMWKTWSDGYEDPTNGSVVGNGWLAEPETVIVYENDQSLPMEYGSEGIGDSWTTREINQDWNQYGIKILSLYFYGDANNIGGQLYVKVNETKFEYNGAATDIQSGQWLPWTIDLSGITTVDTLTVGVLGGSGKLYLDNIRLYPLALDTPVDSNAASSGSIAGAYTQSNAPIFLPQGWTYLYSDAGSGGTEVALTANIAVGNGGNTGFGGPSQFSTPVVLGRADGENEYEIFSNGFEAHTGVEGTDLLLHPGNTADTAFVIARYTVSETDGNLATIVGSFRDLAGGTGGGGANSVTAEIYLNTTNLFSATGAAGRLFQVDGSFNLTDVAVVAGDTISFVVGNNGGFGGDETALEGVITF
ncbi:LamG-like jellyroll fold domain-containing protein [Planctomycetota bacterium]